MSEEQGKKKPSEALKKGMEAASLLRAAQKLWRERLEDEEKLARMSNAELVVAARRCGLREDPVAREMMDRLWYGWATHGDPRN